MRRKLALRTCDRHLAWFGSQGRRSPGAAERAALHSPVKEQQKGQESTGPLAGAGRGGPGCGLWDSCWNPGRVNPSYRTTMRVLQCLGGSRGRRPPEPYPRPGDAGSDRGTAVLKHKARVKRGLHSQLQGVTGERP